MSYIIIDIEGCSIEATTALATWSKEYSVPLVIDNETPSPRIGIVGAGSLGKNLAAAMEGLNSVAIDKVFSHEPKKTLTINNMENLIDYRQDSNAKKKRCAKGLHEYEVQPSASDPNNRGMTKIPPAKCSCGKELIHK